MRYKGQTTPRQVDRDYSHQVEIAIPEGGLGTLLNAMHDFCRGADFRTRGIGLKRLETGRDGVRDRAGARQPSASVHRRCRANRLRSVWPLAPCPRPDLGQAGYA
jgi:hypothetical protein